MLEVMTLVLFAAAFFKMGKFKITLTFQKFFRFNPLFAAWPSLPPVTAFGEGMTRWNPLVLEVPLVLHLGSRSRGYSAGGSYGSGGGGDSAGGGCGRRSRGCLFGQFPGLLYHDGRPSLSLEIHRYAAAIF